MNNFDPKNFGYCPYCMRNPHIVGCPNAPEPKPEWIGYCDLCNDHITDREDRFDIDGVLYHKECFESEYLVTA